MRLTDVQRLQDLLDGLLPREEEIALRHRLEQDESLAREHRELRGLWSLLGTPMDVDPPADLQSRVLAAIRREREVHRALPVPGWLENILVVTAAVGLAGLVTVGRVAGPTAPEWVGRFVVEGTRGFGLMKAAAVDLAQWDWTLRLFATLARASATAIETSATPLTGVTIVALAVSTSIAVALWRRQALGFGGISNVLA